MAPQNLSPLCWRAQGWKLFCQCFGEAYPAGWDSPPFSERRIIVYKLAYADLQNPSTNEAQHQWDRRKGTSCRWQTLPDAGPAISIFAIGNAGHHVQCNWWHSWHLLRTRGETERCVGSMTAHSLRYVGALSYGSVAFRFLHKVPRTRSNLNTQ